MFTKEVAAQRIMRDLPEAENAVQGLQTRIASLAHTLTAAKTIQGVEPVKAQKTLRRIGKVQQILLDADAELMRVHGELLEINQTVKAVTDEDGDCPDELLRLQRVG